MPLIGDQMRRAVNPYLKHILNTSKLKIEMQIEMKWYIFLGLQQLRQIATLNRILRWETGLLNTSLVALQDGVHALGVESGREVASHAPEAPVHVSEAVLDQHILVHPVADLRKYEIGES